MKYLVIGAGGTGGCIGAYLAIGGRDVTIIARGEHLSAISKNGLRINKVSGGTTLCPVKACDMEHYSEKPDVIFVCVKGYSLEETIPFIKRAAKESTVVIPILNIYGTGKRMQPELPELLVTDGCIYISANISGPGEIIMHGDIFKVFYGVRSMAEYRPELKQIADELNACKIDCTLSDNIQRDALQKFSYVSPAAACGIYHNTYAEGMQKPGEKRDCFVALIREIGALAEAMGIKFEVDIVKTNLKIMDSLAPVASTSMQRDVESGKNSEIDGLLFQVVRMGKELSVPVPTYEKIAARFSFTV